MQVQGAAQPLVSVIVPVYNKAAFVGDMMRSVLEQDVGSLELICVDDCSTDESVQVVERFAEQDPRVRLVRHECNQGPGAARNTGITRASGTFLAFLDADDWYNDETYLRRLCQGALDGGVLAAGASLCNVWSKGFVERDFSDNPEFSGYTFKESGIVDYRDYQFDYGSPRFVYARSLFEDRSLWFDSRTFFEDPIVMARALCKAGSFYADAHAAYMYRQEYRRSNWSTRKVIDFLEGVRLNLELSREKRLARLHWLTLRHMEWESYDVGVGVNRNIDTAAVSRKLAEVEAAVDHELIASYDPKMVGFVSYMRHKIELAGPSGYAGAVAALKFRAWHNRLWYEWENRKKLRG